MSTENAPVLLTRRDAVAIVTLNRPDKLNAGSIDLQRGLLDYVRALATEDGVRAVVLTGAGRAFCAGGDLSMLRAFAAGDDAEVHDEVGHINRELGKYLLELDAPTIAAVNGPALGWGAGLVALCDIAVMAEGAYLADPHVKYGLGASPACELVWPHLTSRGIAKEVLMSGREVYADEALRIGLVNRVVPADAVLRVALELAEHLAGLPPNGVHAVKRAFNRSLLDDWALLTAVDEQETAARLRAAVPPAG